MRRDASAALNLHRTEAAPAVAASDRPGVAPTLVLDRVPRPVTATLVSTGATPGACPRAEGQGSRASRDGAASEGPGETVRPRCLDPLAASPARYVDPLGASTRSLRRLARGRPARAPLIHGRSNCVVRRAGIAAVVDAGGTEKRRTRAPKGGAASRAPPGPSWFLAGRAGAPKRRRVACVGGAPTAAPLGGRTSRVRRGQLVAARSTALSRAVVAHPVLGTPIGPHAQDAGGAAAAVIRRKRGARMTPEQGPGPVSLRRAAQTKPGRDGREPLARALAGISTKGLAVRARRA